MSIHDNYSHGNDACAQPFSPMGLFIIGVLVSVSIVLWQLWTVSWHSRTTAADVDVSVDAFVHAPSSQLMQPS